MKRFNHTLPATSRTRPGFTLVELLIVITIIVALMALTISAAMRFIGISEVRTTETLIHKVHDVFDKHWKAAIVKANAEPIPQAVLDFAKPANNETEQNQRARVLYIKLKLLREFPMNFDEATHIQDTSSASKIRYFLPPESTYVTAFAGWGTSGSAAENSACLLQALTRAQSGIKTNQEDFGAGMVGDVLSAAGKPTLQGLIDSWGQPVVFCRWPTGSAEVASLNPATPNSPQAKKFCDPQDPNGLLIPWAGSTNGKAWSNTASGIHPIVDGNGRAFYTTLTIWSFGPDKKFGQRLTDMGNPTSADNDNIYSYRLRLGGS